MLTIVTGGSGSGKSELAEKIAMQLGAPRIYIATMEPFGEEAKERIEKHRKMRAKKQFKTVEKYTGISALGVPRGSSVLLECMSNLCANEIFTGNNSKDTVEKVIIDGVNRINSIAANFVIVTNEIFSDGIQYDNETVQYLKTLGAVNLKIAEIADNVIECVYGIPITVKGKLL